MTRRLYYEDCYQKEFEALITGTGTDEKGHYLVLDQTLFFPEGGGQPADRGTLNGVRVRDVQIADGEIRHYIENLSAAEVPLAAGQKITGRIDWDYRFDLMQQHSGEHIVSGMIHERFGYDNVGFHMGEELITIDLNGEISPDQLKEIEEDVNRYIWSDRKTRAFFATKEEQETLPYRSKLELTGEVRLMEFPGADLCACCGLHVDHTGEIGLVKLISVHHFRSGVRIEMLSGKRAFDWLDTHCRQNSRIASRLSVKPESTYEAVEKLGEENYNLHGRILELEKEKYQTMARQCRGLKDVLIFAENLTPVDIRKCADEILNTVSGICVLMSGNDSDGYRYAAGVREGDIQNLVKTMNQELAGRGGGKPFFAQGSLKASKEAVVHFFEERNYHIFA